MKMIKIIHINLSRGFAGAERHMIDLINYQSKGYKTYLIKSKNNNFINWYIPTSPQTSNGEFSLEYSNSSSFSTYTVNSVVPYERAVTNYTSVLSLTGSAGTNWYYRVKNVKNYQSICGDIISSTAYSETVRVQIQSNAINSY